MDKLQAFIMDIICYLSRIIPGAGLTSPLSGWGNRSREPDQISPTKSHEASTRLPIQPFITFLLGAPGVGKDTLSRSLKTMLPGLTHLSYGDLTRYYDSIPGSWVSSFPRREGSSNPLLPAPAAVKLLRETIDTGAQQYGQMTWVVDGFPRREEHVAGWLAEMAQADCAIYLFCPPEVSIRRVSSRAAYSGRPDDGDPAKVRKRVERINAECGPMLEALEKSGMQVIRVNADRDVETVKEEVIGYVRKAMEKWKGKHSNPA
ncbi:P-loop containing nucleoside triphosphate hydrolase protein [Hypomontagnella submonticulosa]|nr:P-loop containing nucleoside triphosphate hydrolase protein [Hypomontagnella submonticulosa]